MARNWTFAFVALTFFLFSCEERIQEANDTITKDTAANKQGITVADQHNSDPVKVDDSIMDGEHVERYDNGVIFIRGDVKGGLRHGEWLTFYKDGKIWSKGSYLLGYREGYGIAFHPNGKKSQEGYYTKNKMVGRWVFWNELGDSAVKVFAGTVANH
jgi:antitoxin component YwqK of YwqJK toxin-antitoxin module